MAFRNSIINNYKTKIYIYASVATIALMILEILTIIFQSTNSSDFVTLHKIVNIVGFSLSPLVPYIILLFNEKNMRIKSKILLIPLIFNALICVLSFKTEWIFFINDENQYMRGNFFLIPTIMSTFYYILLMISVGKQDIRYDIDDKMYLTFVSLIPVIATFIQILFNESLIIWGSVALSLLLYYVFLRELQFKYDTVSGIKNRATFEKELEKYQKNDINVSIIVFDLNDFKKINDYYGHYAGDKAINIAGKILTESFADIGEPYRVGGDEFCVICKNTTKEIVDNALLKLEHLSELTNQNQDFKVTFSYGYDFYLINENKSIFETYANADKSMYVHKAKTKGQYGRRTDD